MSQRHRLIGTNAPDKLAVEKVTGSGTFVGDLREEGMLHVATLPSDVASGDVRSVDVDGALRLPGVVAVVQRQDVGLDSRIRQYGDLVAAVAAETPEQAAAAVAAIDADVEALPAVTDVRQALDGEATVAGGYDDPGRPEGVTSQGNIVFEDELRIGDIDAGFAKADRVIEGRYRTGRPLHCNLSRHCCIATLRPDGVVDVVTSVDGPFYARRELAKQLGMDEQRLLVRVPQLLSSSFGAHSTINPLHEPVAVALALRAGGRPVRFQFQPDEEFVVGHTRHPTEVTIRAGVTGDGVLTALDIDLLADHGSFANYISRVVVSNFRDRPGELMRLDNYHFRGRVAATNNTNASEMRGIGSTQLMFALGSHMDEVAKQIGLDPVVLYERNALRSGEVAVTTGKVVENPGLVQCLRAGAEALGWDGGATARRADGGRVRGMGVGIGTHTTGLGHEGEDVALARITISADGQVHVAHAAPDSGQGGNTVYPQIVAEELGVPYGDVHLVTGDTQTLPLDAWGTVASRGAFMVGAAVGNAARMARVSLLAAAAGHLGCDPDDLSIEDGAVVVAGSGQAPVPIGDVVAAAGTVEVEADARSAENPPTYGAYFAEVEVDTETGHVEVLRVAAALDVGFALNPALCRGQVEGAVMMGMEMALLDGLELEDGFPRNATFLSFDLASMRHLPSIQTVLVESTEPTGPYGVKGIGTPAITPVVPALCNAVSAAIGKRITAVPIRPEAIVGLCADQHADAGM